MATTRSARNSGNARRRPANNTRRRPANKATNTRRRPAKPTMSASDIYQMFLRPACHTAVTARTRRALYNGSPISRYTRAHLVARMRAIPGCAAKSPVVRLSPNLSNAWRQKTAAATGKKRSVVRLNPNQSNRWRQAAARLRK